MNDEGSDASVHRSSFIAHRFQAAWLSFDAADNDPATFLRYLVAALRTIAPEIGATALALLRSPQLPPINTFVTALLNDAIALPQAALLVLDDYHEITTPTIHRGWPFCSTICRHSCIW